MESLSIANLNLCNNEWQAEIICRKSLIYNKLQHIGQCLHALQKLD